MGSWQSIVGKGWIPLDEQARVEYKKQHGKDYADGESGMVIRDNTPLVIPDETMRLVTPDEKSELESARAELAALKAELALSKSVTDTVLVDQYVPSQTQTAARPTSAPSFSGPVKRGPGRPKKTPVAA